MISNPFFLLSLLIGSFFAFYTAALAIECFIRVFRVKQPRLRASLRLIPFFSLLIDLLFNQYSVAHWLNPLSCASCVQKFFLEVFFPQLKIYLTENQISLISHLGASYQHVIFLVLLIMVGTISFALVLGILIQSLSSIYTIQTTVKNAFINNRAIINPILNEFILRNRVLIFRSNEVEIPLTAYSNVIILPGTLNELSQEEFEAVIAHECEHIRHQDPIVRLFSRLMAAAFWWFPTTPWIMKIEEDQELACDQGVINYQISQSSIASALLKVVRHSKSQHAMCYFVDNRNPIVNRIQTALGHKIIINAPVRGVLFITTTGAALLTMCAIWL